MICQFLLDTFATLGVSQLSIEMWDGGFSGRSVELRELPLSPSNDEEREPGLVQSPWLWLQEQDQPAEDAVGDSSTQSGGARCKYRSI
jgi:hypothetical protein